MVPYGIRLHIIPCYSDDYDDNAGMSGKVILGEIKIQRRTIKGRMDEEEGQKE